MGQIFRTKMRRGKADWIIADHYRIGPLTSYVCFYMRLVFDLYSLYQKKGTKDCAGVALHVSMRFFEKRLYNTSSLQDSS